MFKKPLENLCGLCALKEDDNDDSVYENNNDNWGRKCTYWNQNKQIGTAL